MINAVFFDLNGTIQLAEQSSEKEEIFSCQLLQYLKKENIDLPVSSHELSKILIKNDLLYKHWAEKSLCELPCEKIWNDFYLKEFNIGEKRLTPIAEKISAMFESDRTKNMLRPHVIETLQKLQSMNLVLGIISNTISKSFVPNFLQSFGIYSFFQTITGSEETGIRKPDPEIFNIAAKRTEISTDEMAYIGDTLSRDILGSRNAHLPLAIQIINPASEFRDIGFTGTDLKPNFLIKDFNEIPSIIYHFNEKF